MGLQYGIKEVLNCQVVDFSTGVPIAYVDYAETSNQTAKAVRTDLRGGVGGYKLLSFDSQKDLNFQLTVPLVDLNLMSMLAGDTLATSVAANVFQRDVLTVDASHSVTLTQTPIGTPSVATLTGIRDNGTPFVVTTGSLATGKFTISSKVVTFFTDVAQGTEVVVTYQYATTSSKKFSIKANKFPKTVAIYADAIFRNQETDTDQAVKIAILKARPKSDFTITMDMSNPTKLQLDFDLYPVFDQASGDQVYIDYVLL